MKLPLKPPYLVLFGILGFQTTLQTKIQTGQRPRQEAKPPAAPPIGWELPRSAEKIHACVAKSVIGSAVPASYQPTSRRPIADVFRRTAHGSVNLCLKLGIHPDTVSYGSMVAAAAASWCFWKAGEYPWLLLIGPAFCYFRLWLNMLDGMVALAAGKASWRGEILNDLPDRVSDVLIFVGVAHSGLCLPFRGYWVAILAVLTAYVGMFGQAVGVRREFSGVMAKPWRMVTLHLGAWLAFALGWPRWPSCEFASPTVLDWTCVLILLGCIQTIAVRLRRIMRALQDRSGAR